MPTNDNVQSIARALTKIGEEYLDIHTHETAEEDQQVAKYIEEIKMCGALYAAIIEA